MRADSDSTSAATVWPSTWVASRASTSAGFWVSTMSSRRSASFTKSAFLATKSVSQSSSSRAPSLLTTTPLVVERSRRLPTSLAPLTRRNSTALSKSPSDSVSAFLQSIMPAPVASRRRLTSAAVKSAMSLPSVFGACGPVPLSPRELGREGRGHCSAVLGALRAGVGVAGGRDALDRGDLGRGDRGRLGRGLRQRGGGLGGSGLGRAAGEQLALPVGQRFVAADGRGALLAAGVGLRGRAGHEAIGHGVGDHAGQQGGAADRVV